MDQIFLCYLLICRFYFFYSKIFGTIAVAIAVMKGVTFIRRVLRERSENTDSDSEETLQGGESENSSL